MLKQNKSVSKGYVVLRKKKSVKDVLKKRLDDEWSRNVKISARFVCEKCGKADRLQSHHIFTRSNKSVRWYVKNGVCLCAGHHLFFAHKKPHEFREWIVSVRGQEWWDDLALRARIK